MTDDFQLFSQPGDGGPAVDADVALITAYLSRELSLMQILAVEDRLASDTAFRTAVTPILDAWSAPDPEAALPSPVAARTWVLTPEQRAAGWARHLAEEPARAAGDSASVSSVDMGAASRRPRRWPIARIAAVIVFALLPLIGLAQVVVSIVRRSDGGHATAASGGAGQGSQASPAPLPTLRESVARGTAVAPGGEGRMPASLTPVPGARGRGMDTTVRVAGPARYPGGGTLVPERTIGDSAGFNTIVGASIAADGTMWVLDGGGRGGAGSTPALRQFDAMGKLMRAVGVRGRGPGELVTPTGLVQLADGRLLVRDAGQNRINVYAADGLPDSAWVLPSRYQWIPGGGLLRDVTGIIWMPFFHSALESEAEPLGPKRFLRLTSAGRVIDTVSPPDLPPVPSSAITSAVEGGSISYSAPYAPTNVWTFHPSGTFVTAVTSQYAIDLRVAPSVNGAGAPPSLWKTGDPVISIRRNAPPVEVSPTERAERTATLTAQVQSVAGRPSLPLPEIPRTKPPIKEIRVTNDGRYWVSVSVPSERVDLDAAPRGRGQSSRPTAAPWREPVVYDVFEQTGVYLGRVALPAGVGVPMVARGDEVWFTFNEGNGGQSLRKYRLVWK